MQGSKATILKEAAAHIESLNERVLSQRSAVEELQRENSALDSQSECVCVCWPSQHRSALEVNAWMVLSVLWMKWLKVI